MIIESRPLGKSGNCLVTIAIGEKFFNEWQNYALPCWQAYAEKHDLGILCITDHLICEGHLKWKKPTWQKLLLGKHLLQHYQNIGSVCYIDTDIIVNSHSPDIFNYYDGSSYGLVSKFKNLPFDLEITSRIFSFFRNEFYDKNYPLDSSVFMSPQKIYLDAKLEPFDDYACAGLIMFNPHKSSDEMESWFHKYTFETKSITGGDQTHLNWEMRATGRVQDLPYEYQALWLFEMAWKYPFLYYEHNRDSDLIKDCIETSLLCNHFLHFAGSWYESDMWLIKDIATSNKFNEINLGFKKYLDLPVTGRPKGFVKP
ncbi:hypothetical protein N9M53_03880 [Alphaproteobacteria bacterium]|nr:hypothetical protein [Alphaproteobacteria bacterium]